MKSAQPQANTGIALIIVMVCITVLSILAAGFAYSMKVETKLAMNANNESELISLGKSGVAYAQWVLAQQLQPPLSTQEPYTALNQVWAGGQGEMLTTNSPLAGVPLENIKLGRGSFSIKIVDTERKVNINKLQEPQRTLDLAMRLIGVDAGDAGLITASIQDWMSPDKNSLIGGTESRYYETLDPPYQAKDGPIDDLSELLLVHGIAEMPEVYWGGVMSERLPSAFQNRLGLQPTGGQPAAYNVGLVDLFTPLSSGQININTASASVLQMVPIIDENIAQRIIQLREGEGIQGAEATPFRDPRDALQRAGVSSQLIPQFQSYFTVHSSFFEVQVDAQINGYHRYFYATLWRKNPRDVQVLTFHWKFSPPATSLNASHASAR